MAIAKRENFPSSAETISKRIKETREARGITASEFARLVGVTPRFVIRYEIVHSVREQLSDGGK